MAAELSTTILPCDTISPVGAVGASAHLLLSFYYSLSGRAATGGGDETSSAGVAPRSSDAPTQSPAQILVPLTVPTSLQPIGALGAATNRSSVKNSQAVDLESGNGILA
jgi:hypothetical protein